MAIKIVIMNRKGGVGKTTTALNLSAFLVEKGKKVLAVDLDSQANLTACFNVNIDTLTSSIKDVFTESKCLDEVVSPVRELLHLVPSTPELASVIRTGFAVPAQAQYMNTIFMRRLGESDALYDYIIMDAPSDPDSLPVMNGLAIADYVVIPLVMEKLGLVGVRQLTDVVVNYRRDFTNRKIKVLGILPTHYRGFNNQKSHVQIMMGTEYGPWFFRTFIRLNTRLSESVNFGLPITEFDRRCNGYKNYRDFTDECLQRIESGIGF